MKTKILALLLTFLLLLLPASCGRTAQQPESRSDITETTVSEQLLQEDVSETGAPDVGEGTTSPAPPQKKEEKTSSSKPSTPSKNQSSGDKKGENPTSTPTPPVTQPPAETAPPPPAETTQPVTEESKTVTVTLSADFKTAIAYGSETAKAIAEDGVLLSGKRIELERGASVYDALKKSGLVVGAQNDRMGVYVYSIQSLKMKECGGKSGWLYSVNGSYPSKSCDQYILQEGDVIRWRYTCDNGNDV